MKSRQVVDQRSAVASQPEGEAGHLGGPSHEDLARMTYHNVAQACRYLQFVDEATGAVTPHALYAWVRRHGIPRLKRGRILLFRRRDLDSALTGTFNTEAFIEETNYGHQAPREASAPSRRRARRTA